MIHNLTNYSKLKNKMKGVNMEYSEDESIFLWVLHDSAKVLD